MKKRLSLVLSLAMLAACGQSSSPGGSPSPAATSTSKAAASKAVLVKVNDHPITAADLALKMQTPNHEAAPTPPADKKKAVLDNIVLRELMAQKAVAMGLEADPKYQEDLVKLEAQVADFKRTALSELFLKAEGEKRATPSDEEARAYFTKNEKRIRTQLHIFQILKRSEAEIVEARSMIERGKSFEEVAASYFPNLPPDQKPWDLGFLSFSKIPEPWRDTLTDLKPGEMSGILRGPSERYWLIKLVETKEDPSVTFETAREGILQDMKATRTQRLREGYDKELRDAAKIEIVTPP